MGGKVIRTIFLRRGFGVYLIDQPRRGNAGRSTVSGTITPTPDEQGWFGTFRVGIWPDYFEGVQFARDSATLEPVFPSDDTQCGTNRYECQYRCSFGVVQ